MSGYLQCLGFAEALADELQGIDSNQGFRMDVCLRIAETIRKLDHSSMKYWRVVKIPEGETLTWSTMVLLAQGHAR